MCGSNFILKQLGQKEKSGGVYIDFKDLEKVYDRVNRKTRVVVNY